LLTQSASKGLGEHLGDTLFKGVYSIAGVFNRLKDDRDRLPTELVVLHLLRRLVTAGCWCRPANLDRGVDGRQRLAQDVQRS
jgi:hypothetical protein